MPDEAVGDAGLGRDGSEREPAQAMMRPDSDGGFQQRDAAVAARRTLGRSAHRHATDPNRRPRASLGLSRPLGPRWSASPMRRLARPGAAPAFAAPLAHAGEQLAIRIVPSYGRQRHRSRRRTPPMERNWRDLMRALIAG